MDLDNVASVEADDDFDMTADLAAAFDAAEADDSVSLDIKVERDRADSEIEAAAERARDDKGRFAAKEAAEVAPAKEQPAAAIATKEPVAAAIEQPEPVAGDLRAPPGWSPTAKAAFAELPADHPIKLAVAQREAEVNKGFEKLAAYKPIDRYMEMARQGGTTLDKALENYVGIENELSRDMVSGIARICQNKGIHPVALANQILARNGVAPSEAQAGETQVAHQQATVDLSPIHQELNALKSYVQEQQSAGVQSEIQRFASDPKHTFFENVKADMGNLIRSGYATDLNDAYDKACWANPEIRGLLIKQQTPVSDVSAKAAAASQARAASKSITGSPIPKAGSKGPETSIEDEIRELMDSSV